MSMLDAVPFTRRALRGRVGAARPALSPDGWEHVRAPGRMDYLDGADSRCAAGSEICTLCHVPDLDDSTSLVLHRGRYAYVVLNRYPYNTGHLMVVPRRHVHDYADLSDPEAAAVFELTQRAVAVLRTELTAHGFNIGMNVGEVAGASIADHLHQHVVPRWAGDTNFMPVLDRTRVLPQSLEDTWAVLARGWG